jgi:uncharacterized membrane protein YhaH (DUF805 family)
MKNLLFLVLVLSFLTSCSVCRKRHRDRDRMLKSVQGKTSDQKIKSLKRKTKCKKMVRWVGIIFVN